MAVDDAGGPDRRGQRLRAEMRVSSRARHGADVRDLTHGVLLQERDKPPAV